MSTTPHALRRYAPREDSTGIALCLSGGGFRAALFHLGALRRLNELNILSKLTTVTAVSGGSTIAAHLANTWELWHNGPCSPEVWEYKIAAPFRKFTSRNLSTPAALKQWWPWNWMRNTGIHALAKACEPLCNKTTKELPQSPNFMFCATDLVTGKPRVFQRTDEREWTVGHAVAISSCFPLVFRPFIESKPEYIALVDGGIADNRGVESVWQTHKTLLVSDGGDTMRPQWNDSVFWSLTRSASVLMKQMQLVQKRWLIANYLSKETAGAYWSTDSAASHYRTNPATAYLGYSESLVRDAISTIRLDYDVFSSAEAAVLENHGYLLADAASRTHLTGLRTDAPLHIPHPAWLSDQKVREALRDSSRKRLLGTGAFQAVFGGVPEPIASRYQLSPQVAAAAPKVRPVTFKYAVPTIGTNGAGVIVLPQSLTVETVASLVTRLTARGYHVLVPDVDRTDDERDAPPVDRPSARVRLGDVAGPEIRLAVQLLKEHLRESCPRVGITYFREGSPLPLLWTVNGCEPGEADTPVADDTIDDPFGTSPYDLADVEQAWERILAFLDRHLGEPMSS